MLNEEGLLNGRILFYFGTRTGLLNPRTPTAGCGRPHARRACASPYYFPREVFFFGLGFPVAFCVASACRFCFFVAICSSRLALVATALDAIASGDGSPSSFAVDC
jgi:hypothetical protein